MTIFVDASAQISMMAAESDALALGHLLSADPARICSTVSVWETVAGLCHNYGFSVASASAKAKGFLEVMSIQFVTMGETEFDFASDAYARFGKGRHPAGLNMGDCFAYACAKANRAKLLFKGGDFSLTDIDQARP